MTFLGATHNDVRDLKPSRKPRGKAVMSFNARSLEFVTMKRETSTRQRNILFARTFDAMLERIDLLLAPRPYDVGGWSVLAVHETTLALHTKCGEITVMPTLQQL